MTRKIQAASNESKKCQPTSLFFHPTGTQQHLCLVKYDFPQYRKLSNNLSYYKIESLNSLTEIQRIGNRWTQYEVYAKILPERLLIQDILENEGGRYDTIKEEEFCAFLKESESNFKKF